jgi:hypothetical protein
VPPLGDTWPVHTETPSIERVESLDHFYAALAKLARHNAKDHVRIGVFGDSNLTMDFQTGHLRRLLQARFGDGGHGFVALGKPWSHYRHMDVQHDIEYGWKAYVNTTDPVGDPFYGLGGIAVEAESGGGKTFVATAKDDAPVGKTASRFDVFFLKRKKSGSFEVQIDGKDEGSVDTQIADGHELGSKRFEVTDGPHKLEVVASNPPTRVFGVALERAEPGIVIDTFGIGSLNTLTQAKEDPVISAEMLRDRHYDLIVYMTGANDLNTMKDVPAAIHGLIAMQREALPDASFLILTPADRGTEHTLPLTLAVVKQRKEIASAEGTAFWSLFDAMGGENSMGSFVRANLALSDAVHFNDTGGAWMADRLQHVLLDGFAKYMATHPDAGC